MINELAMTEINGRKVDLRNAEPKISDKMTGGPPGPIVVTLGSKGGKDNNNKDTQN